MDHLRRLRAPTLVGFAAFTFSACSLFPGFFPNPSQSPHELILQELAARQAQWASKAIDDYVITIERQCFCPTVEYEITVADGTVRRITRDGAPVAPADVKGLPTTVPELFALVAGLPAEARVQVAYDTDLGYLAQVSVDPIPNAVDDEYSIVARVIPAS